MKPVLRASLSLLGAAALAAASLVGPAPDAEASPQVYNPCTRLSAGQVRFSAYGAHRVTFATAASRSSDTVTITGCVRSGAGYAQEWQDWGYVGQKGFAAGSTWEDTWKSPSGSFSITEALGRRNPGTALQYHTVNPRSRWGGERGATYNQYFEGAGGESDENLWYYMNQGYYEQAAVINYNRRPDMPTVQGASFAIFFHAGRVPSAGCVSTSLPRVTRLLQTNRPGDRIIMGAVDDVFTPYSSNPFGAISAKYGSAGGTFGPLGAPASDEVGARRDGGAYQIFRNGAINWSPRTGAHISQGAIRSAWARNGFEDGPLGYPTSEEVGGLRRGGVYQTYQGGAIVWAPGVGAYATRGAIRSAYAAAGFEGGPLGYAVSDETGGLRDGGAFQLFQGGAVYWSPAAGAHPSLGAIRTAWARTGYEAGPLGYPTSDELRVGTGVYQRYQGGALYWSPATGAHAVVGDFAAAMTTGGAFAAVGFPVGDQVAGLVRGGAYQSFQNGLLIASPSTGVHVSAGPLRTAWGRTDFERGPLGYPTSDPYSGPGGALVQDYEHGRIAIAAGGAVTITGSQPGAGA
ncbi:L,D-peptidoglycan transpeptidase YkuD (ErfK/YbiS/YcfS/YnhG family) [Sinomonas atrocyanea]|uniref:hypothetical protein n=1 Tax=Sinomonas atrocyanea TaxID=37927 RepID=UPI00278B1E2E|nr:hypothetical protein [Sinomonas atrocyanea]MDP9886355.1 L,D-peptidoglycan transpeptidase YkuD (ErfK/YbiS/YcfS/YnhG family) [Sinomonas atrocyanea]